MDDTWEGRIGLEHRDLTITATEGIAFARCLSHMTGRKKAGDVVDLRFRLTLCLEKLSGTWKIAHAHSSVPLRMDGSNQAEVGLKP